jgi:hypothetical protein
MNDEGMREAGAAFGLQLVRRDAGRAIYFDPRSNADVIVPDGYELVPAVRNLQVLYDFGIKHTRAAYEIRLRFDPYPWEQVEDCAARNRRQPGSCVMADPDAESPVWAMTFRMNLSGGERGTLSAFQDAAVKEYFGGSWGLASDVFEITAADFAGPYLIGQLHQIHKNIVGTYTIVHVADSVATLGQRQPDTGQVIRFREEGV